MSYQVIARKYRPQRFADVVGQEHVTQTLANAIKQNRIAHAYLFCGPRGTGKTTIARIFAKALNCSGGPKADFDDQDERCREITEGRSLDVLEIDGASNNGVEQVRELRETVKFVPAASRFKIFIIDEVHMLSTAAFNALLKTLEEPPAHVKFMFATTDPEKVLPTILSRCQRFDLRRIPVALIVKHLAHIATLEKITVDDPALHAIARGADGGMRDAESALDQLISFCGGRVEESDVLSMFGLTSHAQVLSIALAILRGDAAGVLRELDGLARNGKDLTRLLADVLGHFRNLLVYQVSGGDLSLLEVSESEAEALRQHADVAQADSLTRVMETLTESEGRMREASSKKIFLEVAFLKSIQARNAVGLDAVLHQLNRLRAGGGSGAPASAELAPRSAVVPEFSASVQPPSTPTNSSKAVTAHARESGIRPVPDGVSKISEPRASGLEAWWPQLLESVGKVSQFTRSYLLEAFPVSLTGNVFTIGFDPEFADHIDLVNNSKNIELLQTKLKELGYPNLFVKFTKTPAPQGWKKPSPAPLSGSEKVIPATTNEPSPRILTPATPGTAASTPVPAESPDFKNDPLIQKALEIFRGRIVEVRA